MQVKTFCTYSTSKGLMSLSKFCQNSDHLFLEESVNLLSSHKLTEHFLSSIFVITRKVFVIFTVGIYKSLIVVLINVVHVHSSYSHQALSV